MLLFQLLRDGGHRISLPESGLDAFEGAEAELDLLFGGRDRSIVHVHPIGGSGHGYAATRDQ